jgi:hypothetical protein
MRMFAHPPPVCHLVERSAVAPIEPDVQGTCVGGHAQLALSPPGVSIDVHDLRVRSILARYLIVYLPRCPNVGFDASGSSRSQHSPNV